MAATYHNIDTHGTCRRDCLQLWPLSYSVARRKYSEPDIEGPSCGKEAELQRRVKYQEAKGLKRSSIKGTEGQTDPMSSNDAIIGNSRNLQLELA